MTKRKKERRKKHDIAEFMFGNRESGHRRLD